jgi:hypothetical protein
MKRLHRILTLLLTVVFIYSTTGQAIIFHCCSQKQSCGPKQCCSQEEERNPCCASEKENSFQCCNATGNYIVNPFSVQMPQQQKEIIQATFALFHNSDFFIRQNTAEFYTSNCHRITSGFDPPGRIILLQKSILII